MVAIVNFGENVDGAIRYNEEKVKNGVAVCLEAQGFGCDASELSIPAKNRRFLELNARNLRSEKNTVHIILSFHPTEDLDKSILGQIAADYMYRIGFGDQPYLLYEHADTATPHLHIVSSCIQANGVRLNTHYLGERMSEPARKQIEIDYGLIPASGRELDYFSNLNAIDVELVRYGEKETKGAISNIVRKVTSAYKYESLAELNAILSQFNVVADPGGEVSRLQQYGGLYYSLLNEFGEKVGKQIKASSIHDQPTLANLQLAFEVKKPLKQKFRGRLVRVLDDVLKLGPNREEFVKMMAAEKVSVQFHTNAQEYTYGVTFVDNLTRTVFKGTDLRKDFSATKLLNRIREGSEPEYLFNRLFCRQVLKSTNLSGSLPKVLRSWARKGMLLVIDYGGAKPTYKIGHWRLPGNSFQPVPAYLDQWLNDQQSQSAFAEPGPISGLSSKPIMQNTVHWMVRNADQILDNGCFFFEDAQRAVLEHTDSYMPQSNQYKRRKRKGKRRS